MTKEKVLSRKKVSPPGENLPNTTNSPKESFNDGLLFPSFNETLFGGEGREPRGNPNNKREGTLDYLRHVETPLNGPVELTLGKEEWASAEVPINYPYNIKEITVPVLFEQQGHSFSLEVGMWKGYDQASAKLTLKGLSNFENSRAFIADAKGNFLKALFSEGIPVDKVEEDTILQTVEISQHLSGLSHASVVEKLTALEKSMTLAANVLFKMLRYEGKEIKSSIPSPNQPNSSQLDSIGPSLSQIFKKSNPFSDDSINLQGFEVTPSDVRLTNIGGNTELKKELKTVINQLQNVSFFEDYGVHPPRGILMYGPPGTGKTLGAKAIAGELGGSFYSIKAADILSKYYSESEARVKELFAQMRGQSAKDGRPCVLFIDEIDAIAESREFSSEPSRRVLSQLLQELDGIQSENKDFIVIGATNRKEFLDPAIIRAGRLSKHIYVGVPDQEGRKEIWSIHLESAKKAAKKELFSEKISLETLSTHSEGLVGAEIAEVLLRAKTHAVNEAFEQGNLPNVTQENIIEEIEKFKKERSLRQKNSEGNKLEEAVNAAVIEALKKRDLLH